MVPDVYTIAFKAEELKKAIGILEEAFMAFDFLGFDRNCSQEEWDETAKQQKQVIDLKNKLEQVIEGGD
jgi:hypothetical protein